MTEDVKKAIEKAKKVSKKDKTIKIKESELNELNERLRDATETAQRTMAEFENFKKRTEKDKEEFCKYASCEVISKLLPVLDSFTEAIKKSNDAGLKLIYEQLIKTLEQEGLRLIECIGKKYDSHYHEILLTEISDKEKDTVIEELQRGYILKDKVLRHAKVKVSRGGK